MNVHVHVIVVDNACMNMHQVSTAAVDNDGYNAFHYAVKKDTSSCILKHLLDSPRCMPSNYFRHNIMSSTLPPSLYAISYSGVEKHFKTD